MPITQPRTVRNLVHSARSTCAKLPGPAISRPGPVRTPGRLGAAVPVLIAPPPRGPAGGSARYSTASLVRSM